MFGSAVDRSNRDNDGIEWVIFTAGYGLQRVNYFRRENDRIFRLVRIGAMAAYATDSNVNRIDICVSVAFCYPNAAGFQIGLVMKTEREIRFAEFFVESVLEQRARAIARLFRWLGYEQDRAVPLIF